MDNNCAPLVADLFPFYFVMREADIIEAFNSTSSTLVLY